MPRCDRRAVSFLLTTRCNLNCAYCYGNRNADYKTLDYNFARKALCDYVEKGDINHIRFSADGEPATEMELMKKILCEARRINPDILSEVYTNGTFNEDAAGWLAENLDYIYVSVDLPPDAHDKYRRSITGKPSSPSILRNLEFFKKMPDKRAKTGLRATITKYNVERQIEAIDFYYDNYGIDVFWVNPVFAPVYDKEEKTYEPVDMMQFAKAFVDAHAHAWRRGVFYESNLTSNFDGETNKACCSCLPMPYLTVDGYLSACELATYGKHTGRMEPMIYARYDAENDKILYDQEKVKALRGRTLANMSAECRSCFAGKHCAGYCLGETLNENGSLFNVKANTCKALKYIYSEIGHLYAEKFGTAGFPYKCP